MIAFSFDVKKEKLTKKKHRLSFEAAAKRPPAEAQDAVSPLSRLKTKVRI